MARSLIGGLLARGFAGERIVASDPSSECLAAVRELGAQTVADNEQLAARANVVVLAVKPQVMQQVLQPLA
ncbi:MAG: NAD(P)-binding domain-containing protein, partial [Gammaproteobacteria bacterium]|nr:NAD(P)-binding domain-containing protein [Gammaproteobacteria bacterium]